MARLEDVCIQITDGSHNPPTSVEKSKYLMISSKNIDDDCITLNNPRYLSKEDFDTENKRTNIEPGDLLMTIVGTIGRAAIMPNSFTKICVQRSVAVLKPKSDIVYNRFLMYYLQSMRPYLERESRGVAQKGIYLKQIGSLTIFLPPLDEQRKIAAVLDKVSDLIAKRRQQLDKLDTLMKARFVEMFGDPISNPYGYRQAKLADVADYFNGLTYKPENVSDEGIIVLRSSNIQSCQLDFADTVRVSCKVKDRFMVQENDILMCSRNGSARLVGKVALIKNQQEPMSFGAFMMIIRSRYYSYLMTYFQMDAFRQQIKTGATTTINQITGKMLDDVTIPLPPMMLVEQFASFIEQTNKSKLSIQKSCEKLETLKKSLMQQYFG